MLAHGDISFAVDAAGNLTVTDTSPVGSDNQFAISADGDSLRISDASALFTSAPLGWSLGADGAVLRPLAGFQGAVTFHGGAGDDTLTIDLSGGDVIPDGGITFHGESPTSGAGDTLNLVGGDQGTVVYNYTNAHDGDIALGNYGLVTYTGLEPISNSGTATDVIFNLPAAASIVTLGDDTASGNGMSRLSSSPATFEQTDFANPTGSVTINRGNAADTITVNALPDLTSAVTLGSAANPFAVTAFSGAISLGSGKSLAAYAANGLTVGSALTINGGAVQLSADSDANGTGTLTVSASGSLAAGAGAISLRGADMVLTGPVASSTSVTLTAEQATRPLSLGSDVAGSVGLTDPELNRITSPVLIIGDPNLGTISINADITRSAATAMQLISGAAINFVTGGVTTAGGNLLLDAGTTVGVAKSGVDVTTGAGTLSFGSGDDLALAISGATVDSQYARLNVAGLVNLTGLDLVLTGSYVPPLGTSFTIVNNDNSDAVVGQFNGLPEGASVTINGAVKRITYVGGDGNDVVLLSRDIQLTSVAFADHSTGGAANTLARRRRAGLPEGQLYHLQSAVERELSYSIYVRRSVVGFHRRDRRGRFEQR